VGTGKSNGLRSRQRPGGRYHRIRLSSALSRPAPVFQAPAGRKIRNAGAFPQVTGLASERPTIVRVFGFMPLTSVPGRIRTCAHGSGEGCRAGPDQRKRVPAHHDRGRTGDRAPGLGWRVRLGTGGAGACRRAGRPALAGGWCACGARPGAAGTGDRRAGELGGREAGPGPLACRGPIVPSPAGARPATWPTAALSRSAAAGAPGVIWPGRGPRRGKPRCSRP
jgi:hypothetical protein